MEFENQHEERQPAQIHAERCENHSSPATPQEAPVETHDSVMLQNQNISEHKTDIIEYPTHTVEPAQELPIDSHSSPESHDQIEVPHYEHLHATSSHHHHGHQEKETHQEHKEHEEPAAHEVHHIIEEHKVEEHHHETHPDIEETHQSKNQTEEKTQTNIKPEKTKKSQSVISIRDPSDRFKKQVEEKEKVEQWKKDNPVLVKQRKVRVTKSVPKKHKNPHLRKRRHDEFVGNVEEGHEEDGVIDKKEEEAGDKKGNKQVDVEEGLKKPSKTNRNNIENGRSESKKQSSKSKSKAKEEEETKKEKKDAKRAKSAIKDKKNAKDEKKKKGVASVDKREARKTEKSGDKKKEEKGAQGRKAIKSK